MGTAHPGQALVLLPEGRPKLIRLFPLPLRPLTWGTSASRISRIPGVAGASGSLKSLRVRAMVMRWARRLNPTLMSFRGLRERCQYCVDATGLGSTTPAV